MTEGKHQGRYSVRIPNKPLDITCTLFWKGKEHHCSCGHPSRPCSHLVACLYVSKKVSNFEDVLGFKKSAFKRVETPASSRKQLKGSKKTPAKNYFKNPALGPLVTPLNPADYELETGNQTTNASQYKADKMLVSRRPERTSVKKLPFSKRRLFFSTTTPQSEDTLPVSVLDATLEGQQKLEEQHNMKQATGDEKKPKSQLEIWDGESKELRTPLMTLRYLHRLQPSKTFHIEKTKLYGRVSFHSSIMEL